MNDRQIDLTPPKDPRKYLNDLTPMEPTKLFDNLYYVGTPSVGIFVVDTGEGLVTIDAGWGPEWQQMAIDMKKLGLDPANITLIMVSHEHGDHYGGVQYLKNNICPKSRVALSQIGWNYLRARSVEKDLAVPRPEVIDVFLTDGQKISMGNTEFHIIATPGHSPGCVSFIFPTKDNNAPHMVGIMGGTGCNPDCWERAYLYKSSIDYFNKFTREAKCDVGLKTHAVEYEPLRAELRRRKPGDSNPLVFGTEKFESIYLQLYRNMVNRAMEQLPPEKSLGPPPFIK